MRKNKIKIIITNSHANNRGDEAAQRNLIDNLRKFVPSAKILVLTGSTRGLELQKGIDKSQTFVASKISFFLIILWALLRSRGIRLPFFKNRKTFKLLEKMATADLIISSPGGPYIGDLYISHELNEHLLHIYLAKIFKKPTMIYAPSMGPFKSGWRNKIRKYILNKVEIITLRDHISKKYLDSLQLTHPLIYLTADSAFQSIININKEKITKLMIKEKIIKNRAQLKRKMIVGITPAGSRWNYKNSENPEKRQKQYNLILAKTIDYIIDKLNATVVFFPQLYGESNDLPLIYNIIKLVDKKADVKVFSKKWNSDIQQAIISQMDLFIGNRYHSIIFALKGKVPVVCLAYEHKAIGVMNAVKLNKFVIKINNLSYKILTNKVDLAWEKKEKIKNTLKSQINTIRKLSLVNSILVRALVNCTMRHTLRKKELKKEIDKSIADFQQGKFHLL